MKVLQLISFLSLIAASNAVSFGELEQNILKTQQEQRLLEFSSSNQGWFSHNEMLELKRKGIRFIDITDHQEFYQNQISALSDESSYSFPEKLSFQEEIHELTEQLDKTRIEKDLTKLTSFYTRYAKSQHGLDSSLWLADYVSKMASVNDKINVSLFDHDWMQKSLIARFPGKSHPERVIVIGAHQDSINLILPSILAAPGADDDGSGTCTTLEAFRVLVANEFEPENTVEFHWYSAEELGLWGSQAIFTEYATNGIDVRAMIQQDMTGYVKATLDNGLPETIGVLTDYVDAELTEFTKILIDEYCDIGYVETQCGYGCSDHASASKAGYRSAGILEAAFDNMARQIHTTSDTLDRLSFDHMVQHAKLTVGFAYELGNFNFEK